MKRSVGTYSIAAVTHSRSPYASPTAHAAFAPMVQVLCLTTRIVQSMGYCNMVLCRIHRRAWVKVLFLLRRCRTRTRILAPYRQCTVLRRQVLAMMPSQQVADLLRDVPASFRIQCRYLPVDECEFLAPQVDQDAHEQRLVHGRSGHQVGECRDLPLSV